MPKSSMKKAEIQPGMKVQYRSPISEVKPRILTIGPEGVVHVSKGQYKAHVIRDDGKEDYKTIHMLHPLNADH